MLGLIVKTSIFAEVWSPEIIKTSLSVKLKLHLWSNMNKFQLFLKRKQTNLNVTKISSNWPGLRSSESEVKPHLVPGLAEVAEIPVWGEGQLNFRKRMCHNQHSQKIRLEGAGVPYHYLWASSSSLTALRTAFKLLFSSFSTRVASLWSTRATLNMSTVSLGATWRAWLETDQKDYSQFQTTLQLQKKNICNFCFTIPSATFACTLGVSHTWRVLLRDIVAPQCSDICKISSGSSHTVAQNNVFN